jgi:hypothetical protein
MRKVLVSVDVITDNVFEPDEDICRRDVPPVNLMYYHNIFPVGEPGEDVNEIAILSTSITTPPSGI